MNSDIQGNSDFALSEHITRDYRILRLLGKGGMGEVYLAEQLRVGRRLIALKVLSSSFAASPEMAQRFENEASSAGRINHRNVVTVYESRITEDGQIYVAMEFVKGKSLTDVMKEQSPLPLQRVVEIAKQICSGLAAAHKHGIVHRDIKPDNIMLTEEDGEAVVKLLDFGIARLSEADAAGGKTRAGVIMGTPTYMSPEQAMGKTGDLIDARSDIYSVGMVVYQMLTGHVAFKAQSAMEMMRKHISEPPLSFKQWQADQQVPEAVEQVVLKALQKNRELRQQNILAFASELEAAAKGVSPEVKVSQKDMPTIRITKETPLMATAPLSTEKTAAPSNPMTHRPQGLPAHSKPAPPVAPPPVAPPVANQRSASGNLQDEMRNRPNTINDSGPGGGRKKQALIAALALLAIIAVVATIIKITGKSGSALISPALSVRILRENSASNMETLGLDNQMKTGEGISFEVKLDSPGTIYLFGEQADNQDGSWQWLKSKTSTPSPGEATQFPHAYWAGKTDPQPGLKTYLIVFVPAGANWSATTTISSREFPTTNNVAILPQQVAAFIRETLKKEAVEMNAVSIQQGTSVSYALAKKGDASRIAFYEIKLTQTP